jgi:hypothetical protein
MPKDDTQVLREALQAIETLYFRNEALELLLAKYAPSNWKSLVDGLANDERLYPEVRDRFRRMHAELRREQVASSTALIELLRALPIGGKPS